VTSVKDSARPAIGHGYDVKTLDRVVPRGGAREIRLLDQALKATNAKTMVDGYNQDDAVLGELA
jgi:hypothetical protein